MTRHAETRIKNQRPNLPKNRQRAFPVRLIHIYPQGTSALTTITMGLLNVMGMPWKLAQLELMAG
jgi:hypothetical protein